MPAKFFYFIDCIDGNYTAGGIAVFNRIGARINIDAVDDVVLYDGIQPQKMERITQRKFIDQIGVGILIGSPKYNISISKRRSIYTGKGFDASQCFTELPR